MEKYLKYFKGFCSIQDTYSGVLSLGKYGLMYRPNVIFYQVLLRGYTDKIHEYPLHTHDHACQLD